MSVNPYSESLPYRSKFLIWCSAKRRKALSTREGNTGLTGYGYNLVQIR